MTVSITLKHESPGTVREPDTYDRNVSSGV